MIYSPKSTTQYLVEQMEKAPSKEVGIRNGVKIIIESINHPEEKKRKPVEVFNLQELFHVFVGIPIPGMVCQQIQEAIEPTAFPTVSRELISKMVINAYETTETIGDELTTKFVSKKEVDKITGFTATGSPKKLLPGVEYPAISFEDKWAQVEYEKYGRRIDITEEAVLFDQTGQLQKRANDIGEGAKYYKEKLILEGIQDINSTVYKPSGTATALYASGNSNLKGGNALVNESDFSAARTQLRTALKADDVDTRYTLMPSQFIALTPDALVDTAAKVLSSNNLPASMDRGINVWGPAMQVSLRRRTTLLSSPILDDSSTSTWYFGAPKKQFVWKEVFPFRLLRIAGNPVKDIIATVLTRFAGQVGCTDTRFFIKNTSAA